jgi:hypothetical protein
LKGISNNIKDYQQLPIWCTYWLNPCIHNGKAVSIKYVMEQSSFTLIKERKNQNWRLLVLSPNHISVAPDHLLTTLTIINLFSTTHPLYLITELIWDWCTQHTSLTNLFSPSSHVLSHTLYASRLLYIHVSLGSRRYLEKMPTAN